MATFSTARAALAAKLDTINGLFVYDTLPGTVDVPAAIVQPAVGQFVTYDTSTGSDDYNFTVLLIVSAADDGIAQDALDAYVAASGPVSIKATIEADPDLGGVVDYAIVSSATDYGLHEVGAVNYWGCRFPVVVGVQP